MRKLASNRGFTLVELVIAVSIFAFMSTMTVINYNDFNNRISVDVLAHQIAQYGHEAQVSAMSVKRAAGSSNYPGYGIHFDAASTTNFVFFADLNDDKTFNNDGVCGGGSDECERMFGLPKGIAISQLCAYSTATTSSTTCPVGFAPLKNFDVVFKRPNPDALISGTFATSSATSTFSRVQVSIKTVKGYQRSVEFWNTGQMVVKGQ